jgi:uncharacterized protein involved in exopolysaccharide biosynthesis
LQDLAQLKSRYTPRHPDVIQLENRIKERQKSLIQEGEETDEGILSSVSTANAAALQYIKRTEKDLKEELESVELQLRRILEEEKKLKERIAEYQQRVEMAPKREQELISLTRDYNNMQGLYQSLQMKKMEAEQAKTLEQRQKGEQFRVLDPAYFPMKPYKPDVRKLLLLSVALGLGTGCGLAFLLEYMDRSIKDPEDLEALTGMPVLAVIPRIEDSEEKKAKKKAPRAA